MGSVFSTTENYHAKLQSLAENNPKNVFNALMVNKKTDEIEKTNILNKLWESFKNIIGKGDYYTDKKTLENSVANLIKIGELKGFVTDGDLQSQSDDKTSLIQSVVLCTGLIPIERLKEKNTENHLVKIITNITEKHAYLKKLLSQAEKEADPVTRANILKLAAAKDSGVAMYNLGVCYAKGLGVVKNDKSAAEWYEKAAHKGNVRAMYYIGIRYKNGQGVNMDLERAHEWLQKAANAGNAEAMDKLGILYENGFGVAQNNLTAADWYRKGAANKCAEAMYHLGICYEKGIGVDRDSSSADKYFKQAVASLEESIQKGDPWADYYRLGVCYEEGRGVAKDLARAGELFEKAAKK